MMIRTKIVATIGPSSSSKEALAKMIEAGLNVARLNFSHGAYEDHQTVIDHVRQLNKEIGTNTALLAHLQGPKLRGGEMENGCVELQSGKKITISKNKKNGTTENHDTK